ncbi:hypothetical protein NDU88_001952 [Pleurodeles waltl]|uniref:Uncharacterized protein n=1 Tax=Pleurodeles waltl TaxID=8319 RepID=A0AAV7REG0_PLEWA|nr:hypothetical protein NDU88_001952 [Pleurodeles waltl]
MPYNRLACITGVPVSGETLRAEERVTWRRLHTRGIIVRARDVGLPSSDSAFSAPSGLPPPEIRGCPCRATAHGNKQCLPRLTGSVCLLFRRARAVHGTALQVQLSRLKRLAQTYRAAWRICIGQPGAANPRDSPTQTDGVAWCCKPTGQFGANPRGSLALVLDSLPQSHGAEWRCKPLGQPGAAQRAAWLNPLDSLVQFHGAT